MKTKSLFFAGLVLASTVAFAAGKNEPRTGMVIVPVKGSEVFKVIYKGEATGKVKLNIYNENARVIMTETFNSVDGFICPLNFAGLEPGGYTIELVDVTGKKFEEVITLSKKADKYVHISRINGESKYLLSVANITSTDQVNVKIFDGRNNLIHSETKALNGDFAQVYKLDGESSSYTFEVSDNSGIIKTSRF